MSEAGSGVQSNRAAARSAGVYAFALIVSLFFLWGVANNLNDILIKQFKKVFELSDFRAGLVQSAFYAGYFLLAIPASLCMRRFGYKAALLVGLLFYATGAFLFYPAAALRTYGLFLGALFVIASGLAFLETAANPLVTVLGHAEGAARRLNLAQSFNPLGSITGVLIGQNFIFSGVELSPAQLGAMTDSARSAYYASQSTAVQAPYLVIGAVVLLWALLIATVRLPVASAEREAQAGEPQSRALLRNTNYLFAVVAQFFYVGGQVGIWSYLIRYAQQTIPGLSERHAADFLTAALVLFMIGRFAGTALMRAIPPARLLALFASIALALVAVALFFPGPVGVGALVATAFFMSINFPTIFALGLRGLSDEERKSASSFLVMAIIGGATLTVVMGAISDAFGIHRAMIVPIVCFAVVRLFAGYTRKLTTAV
ncbi:MAG: L-fucose:H+ symporter permease [Steroidobacteraceae bacterium]